MKNLVITLIPTLAAIAAAGLVLALSLGDSEAGMPATAMSLDMDTTGTIPPTTLSERDDCIQASAGDSVTFDVIIEGVPLYVDNAPMGVVSNTDEGGMTGFAYDLNFNSDYFTVTGAFEQFMISVNAGSAPFSASDAVPDSTSPWLSSVLDTGAGAPESGDGILSRVSVGIDASTPTGSYPLTLTNLAHGAPDGFYTPDTTNNGRIAVGQDCSVEPTTPPATTAPATATPTPSPTPSGSPGTATPSPTPSPTASGSPGPGTPTPTPSGSVTPAPSATPFPYPKGDNQCDNDVDAVDALQDLRYVAGFDTVQEPGCPNIGDEFASPFGDMDCDDDVDAVDALKILQHVAGFDTNLPGGCSEIGELYS